MPSPKIKSFTVLFIFIPLIYGAGPISTRLLGRSTYPSRPSGIKMNNTVKDFIFGDGITMNNLFRQFLMGAVAMAVM